jgi:hypothetical protein
VGIEDLKVVWIEIDNWVIDKMALEEVKQMVDGTKGKRDVKYGS